jgi:hypothetical protein
MFIPDSGSEFLPSRISIFSIPDPRSASKNLRNLTQKTVSKLALRNMIHFVHPGSRSRFFTHPRFPIQGSKKAPDPGSATLGLIDTGRSGMIETQEIRDA